MTVTGDDRIVIRIADAQRPASQNPCAPMKSRIINGFDSRSAMKITV